MARQRTEPGREAPGAIIVFDGVCVLCNGWVRFLLRHDHAGRYRFVAMQGGTGRRLLAAHGLDPRDPSSFLLIEGERSWRDTDAIRRVVAGLGGAWRFAHALTLLPRPLRDALYRLVARNRYRLFGMTTCHVPDAAERWRFID